MRTVFGGDRPLVFAHRGGCALGPENTIAAFDRGVAAGADGLELDVHLAADGVPVVHHDSTLDRTTDASGPIAARTSTELARIDAAAHFVGVDGNSLRGQGIGVPTLSEVLRRYSSLPLIIEMKVDTIAMAVAVADVVRRADSIERVCVAGFGRRSLRAIRSLVPEMATSASQPEARIALYRSWVHWPLRRPPFGGYQVPEVAGTIRVVTPRFIRHAHRAGLKVQIWTVDTRADMDRLLAWGADALISNYPDVAVTARDAFLAAQASRTADLTKS